MATRMLNHSKSLVTDKAQQISDNIPIRVGSQQIQTDFNRSTTTSLIEH